MSEQEPFKGRTTRVLREVPNLHSQPIGKQIEPLGYARSTTL
jgi:hypothetical protein